MTDVSLPWRASLIFLLCNVVVLLLILLGNRFDDARKLWARRRDAAPGQRPGAASDQPEAPELLDPKDVLSWEFDYARETASQAMQDRHTMMNFYLLIMGVFLSAVVVVLNQQTKLPKGAATALLWPLCGIGWFYFLSLIRLRQAWYESALAMNQIKDFYIRHAKDIDPARLATAFRWRTPSLPPPQKAWTVFFYAAMLIAFLNSIAFVVGGALMNLDAAVQSPQQFILPLIPLGLFFFAFHIVLYFAFLTPLSARKPGDPAPKTAN